MRRALIAIFALGAACIGILALGSVGIGPVVITREGEQRLVLFLSTPWATLTEPGLSFRPPVPIVTKVLTFDSRLLYLNTPTSKIQTRDQERIVIDNYVMWRISEPLLFYKSFKGNTTDAESRISDVISADVRQVVGQHTLEEVLSDSRLEIMKVITKKSAAFLSERGIGIEDVRINRTELPEASIQNVYARMRTERERLARKYRAEGDEEGRQVRAEADRQSKVLVAEAQRDADLTRAEGNGKAAAIYAAAYSRAPEFYAFWRSLEAYRVSLGEGTTLVLSPEGGFFEFLDPSRLSVPSASPATD